jgi:hypothetical protein
MNKAVSQAPSEHTILRVPLSFSCSHLRNVVQEALVQKDNVLEEKNQLIARLSKGLTDSRMQCKTASQENESLQRDIAQLHRRLAQNQQDLPQEPQKVISPSFPNIQFNGNDERTFQAGQRNQTG